MFPYEKDILLEAEGLQYLSKLFQGFINLLEEAKEEYGDALDPNLVVCLEIMQYDAALTLDSSVKFEDVTVPGINKQLEDTMDQVQTLQAGLPTKKGITDEDCEEADGQEDGDET